MTSHPSAILESEELPPVRISITPEDGGPTSFISPSTEAAEAMTPGASSNRSSAPASSSAGLKEQDSKRPASVSEFKKRRHSEMGLLGPDLKPPGVGAGNRRISFSEQLREEAPETSGVASASIRSSTGDPVFQGLGSDGGEFIDGSASQLMGSTSTAPIRQSNKEEHKSKFKCVEAIKQFKKKLALPCRQLNKHKVFQAVMFSALLSALFLPDVWVMIDRSNNVDLDVILTLVLLAFLVELIVQTLGFTKTYLGSFFFWMDLVGAASLLLDITYLPLAAIISGGGTAESDSLASNTVVMRAARIAKLGARAGRFTRLVKLLRYLPGMRNQGTDAGTAKRISSRLTTTLSTRVSFLIIVIVMVMPLFGMFSYPEQDWSMISWVDILDGAVIDHPERLETLINKIDAFYETLDHYPWTIRAKDPENIPSVARSMLPWFSARGAPQRSTNSMEYVAQNIVCVYNFKQPNQIDSLMNVLLLLTIMVLMVTFSLILSNSVNKIVLRPLDKLLAQVRTIASTIFQSVTDMAVNMRNDEEEEKNNDDEADNEEEVEKVTGFTEETDLLEKVVQKLAVLSEIAMGKPSDDAETKEGEGDKAVVHETARESLWGDEEVAETDSNHELVLQAQKAMLDKAGLALDLVDSWNLNSLELDRARNHAAAVYFLGPHNHGIHVDSTTMDTFVEAAELAYIKTCPYHNWFHAVDVAHCVYRLLRLCRAEKYLTSAERYALLVSSVCHDVGHPGLNNTFLIETSHELALRYNDKSPLESMSSAKLFELVDKPTCNIFNSLSKPQFQEIRKLCVDAILHTDNTYHFNMVKEVQMFYEVNSEAVDASFEQSRKNSDSFPSKDVVECFKQPDSRRLLLNVFLHVADISNSTKPFRICKIWAWQVLEEFAMQGDVERRMGVPVQALNDRDGVNRPLSQVGFIEYLVAPLLLGVLKLLPPTEPLDEQMIRNARTWNQNWQNETKPTPSEQERQALADRIAKLEQRYHDAQS